MLKIHHLLILVGIVALAALTIGVYQANTAPLPEGFPEHTAPNQIEVKQYPSYRAATYQTRGELSQAAKGAFSPLYQHISTNNISMTAPVETRYPASTLEGTTSGAAEVSFLYPSREIVPAEIALSMSYRIIFNNVRALNSY